MSVAPAARLTHDTCTEDRKWSGSDEGTPECGECESIEYAQTVFGILHMLEDIFRFLHEDTRRYGGDFEIREDIRNLAQRIRSDDRIRIQTADEFGMGM